ncbi:MAG: hypothetical protein ACOXZH_00045 [Bacteroidales bacterium]
MYNFAKFWVDVDRDENNEVFFTTKAFKIMEQKTHPTAGFP